jgi:predicted XRE-type DNA-binding protein
MPNETTKRGKVNMRAKPGKKNRRGARVTEGSRNVFVDLGLPNPEQDLLKARLTLQIYRILKDSGMTQVQIAKILGVQQPQVSLLMRNRGGNFSIGRLMEFLTALRQDVEITVRPTRKEHGALSVVLPSAAHRVA